MHFTHGSFDPLGVAIPARIPILELRGWIRCIAESISKDGSNGAEVSSPGRTSFRAQHPEYGSSLILDGSDVSQT